MLAACSASPAVEKDSQSIISDAQTPVIVSKQTGEDLKEDIRVDAYLIPREIYDEDSGDYILMIENAGNETVSASAVLDYKDAEGNSIRLDDKDPGEDLLGELTEGYADLQFEVVIEPGETSFLAYDLPNLSRIAQIDYSVKTAPVGDDYSPVMSSLDRKLEKREDSLFGELTNNGSEAIEYLQVAAVMFKDGKPVQMDAMDANSETERMEPGEQVQFTMYRHADPAEYDDYRIAYRILPKSMRSILENTKDTLR